MPINNKPLFNIEWLIVSLLSAGARVLETAAMILPVKAVFLIMKPEFTPELWLQSGLTTTHLLIAIVVSTLVMFISSKIILVLAKRRAHNLHPSIDNDNSEQMALITTKISSSIMVMFVFCIIIGALDLYALLLLATLISLSYLHPPPFMHELQSRINQLLGITQNTARYRFTSQLLFQLYFIAMITLALFHITQVSIVLLLVILVGRRFFQEYSRFKIGLFQREELVSGKIISE